MSEILGPQVQWWELVLRTLVIYVVVLVLLRFAGKRELGQMTTFDLVVIILIANAVQNAMTGPDTTIAGGVLAATTLIVANVAVSRVFQRFPSLSRLFAGSPTLLVEDGKVLQENLKRENISLDELEMAAREHGIEDLKDVTLAVLEVDGSISIVHKGEYGRAARTLRRFRQFKQRP